MKALIVAYDTNRGIGTGTELPWGTSLPRDLKHFRILTQGTSVIMGRKTFESIGSKPLPDRQNIVVTSHPTRIDGVISVNSLDAAYAMCQYQPMVIGGESVYRLTLESVDRIYATEVAASFSNASVYFPSIDMSIWHEVSREHHDVDDENMYPFDFVIYEKVSKS